MTFNRPTSLQFKVDTTQTSLMLVLQLSHVYFIKLEKAAKLF